MLALVCGSRSWGDYDSIYEVLKDLLEDRRDMGEELRVIQGGAKGADRHALHACRSLGIPCDTFEADWDKHGRAAGPIRNRKMLRENPDVVIAFRDFGESPGTDHMVLIAREANVPVKVFR